MPQPRFNWCASKNRCPCVRPDQTRPDLYSKARPAWLWPSLVPYSQSSVVWLCPSSLRSYLMPADPHINSFNWYKSPLQWSISLFAPLAFSSPSTVNVRKFWPCSVTASIHFQLWNPSHSSCQCPVGSVMDIHNQSASFTDKNAGGTRMRSDCSELFWKTTEEPKGTTMSHKECLLLKRLVWMLI